MKPKYIKLLKAVDTHKYVAELIADDGMTVESKPMRLSDLDKLCPKHSKMRVNTNAWGLVVHSYGEIVSIMPINNPFAA